MPLNAGYKIEEFKFYLEDVAAKVRPKLKMI